MSRALYPPQTPIQAHVFELLHGDCPAGIAEADAPADAAENEAYERGLAEGRAAAEQQLLSAAQALVVASRQFHAASDALAEEMKHDVLTLSLALARRMLIAEVTARPEVINQIVGSLMQEAEERKAYGICLNPEDIERLTPETRRLLEEAKVSIQPAPQIAQGGCVLETAFGKLDARMETRIEEVSRALLGRENAKSESPETADVEAEVGV